MDIPGATSKNLIQRSPVAFQTSPHKHTHEKSASQQECVYPKVVASVSDTSETVTERMERCNLLPSGRASRSLPPLAIFVGFSSSIHSCGAHASFHYAKPLAVVSRQTRAYCNKHMLSFINEEIRGAKLALIKSIVTLKDAQ